MESMHRTSLPTIALLAGLMVWPGRGLGQPAPLATGIAEVSRGKLVLSGPPDRPPRGSLRYALAFPFQAGPRTFGLMVMRMTEEVTVTRDVEAVVVPAGNRILVDIP